MDVDPTAYTSSRKQASPRPLVYDDMINGTIAYGRELNSKFSEEKDLKLRERFKETMKELFGMLAYKDPRESPAAHWLELEERGKLAEALNGAILGMLTISTYTLIFTFLYFQKRCSLSRIWGSAVVVKYPRSNM